MGGKAGAQRATRGTRRDKREDKRSAEVINLRDEAARKDGPDKQHWTTHDVVSFRPANKLQEAAIRAYHEGDDIALLGAPGTGKTLLTAYLSGGSLVSGEDIKQIIIVRSAVQERQIGFTPGFEEEKLALYEAPYIDAFATVFGHPTSYGHLKNANKVVFTSTTFKRGVNFRNAVVILEEVQNYSVQELKTLIGRCNDSCRLIITGDNDQCDLGPREVSGLPVLQSIAKDMHRMFVVEFKPEHSQRGQRVIKMLQALAALKRKEKKNASSE